MKKILKLMYYSIVKFFNLHYANSHRLILFNSIAKSQDIDPIELIEPTSIVLSNKMPVHVGIPSIFNYDVPSKVTDLDIVPKIINSEISPKLYFPKLEVLNKITNKIKSHKPFLNNYLLIAGQHILNTTGSLLEWMIHELSLPTENIYLIGKSYSNAKNVVQIIQESFNIHYQPNSRQIALGGFNDSYDTDISLLWNKLFIRLTKDLSNNKKIDGILVLDDGGHLLKKIPADIAYLTDVKNNPIPIVGIEQTRSGINGSKKFPHPIIEVATSAAKHLEAPMIATQIEDMLVQIFNNVILHYNKILELHQLSFGVVGLGKIGAAVVRHLKLLGYYNLIAFDYDDTKKNLYKKNEVHFAKNIIELIKSADIILGCTGTDFMNTNKIKLPKCIHLIEKNTKPYPKIFISLSSNDIEFNSLLTHIHHNNRNNNNTIVDPLSNIIYPKNNPCAIIVNGGMPFNFMKVHMGLSDYSIHPTNIQLVRGLLAAAILQAHGMMLNRSNNINAGQYKLDPAWQSFIVQSWLECTKQPKNNKFYDLNWISDNSGGQLWDPLHYTAVNLSVRKNPKLTN